MDTAAEDPAFLIYTSGTTGDPKGALHAHRIVFGHLPAFEAIFEFYPQAHEVLWSPADWAWIAGIMDILVPAWFHGLPVVVDREPAFTAERAVWLMREFAVTLTLLPATALRVIRASGMEGGGFAFRSVASGGEALGADLLKWSEEFFGATVNEGYGQTELNACIGNCASVYPIRPGSLGKGLPGPRSCSAAASAPPVGVASRTAAHRSTGCAPSVGTPSTTPTTGRPKPPLAGPAPAARSPRANGARSTGCGWPIRCPSCARSRCAPMTRARTVASAPRDVCAPSCW